MLASTLRTAANLHYTILIQNVTTTYISTRIVVKLMVLDLDLQDYSMQTYGVVENATSLIPRRGMVFWTLDPLAVCCEKLPPYSTKPYPPAGSGIANVNGVAPPTCSIDAPGCLSGCRCLSDVVLNVALPTNESKDPWNCDTSSSCQRCN